MADEWFSLVMFAVYDLLVHFGAVVFSHFLLGCFAKGCFWALEARLSADIAVIGALCKLVCAD